MFVLQKSPQRNKGLSKASAPGLPWHFKGLVASCPAFSRVIHRLSSLHTCFDRCSEVLRRGHTCLQERAGLQSPSSASTLEQNSGPTLSSFLQVFCKDSFILPLKRSVFGLLLHSCFSLIRRSTPSKYAPVKSGSQGGEGAGPGHSCPSPLFPVSTVYLYVLPPSALAFFQKQQTFSTPAL